MRSSVHLERRALVIVFTRQTRVVPDVVGENRTTTLNAVLGRDLTLAPQIDLPSLAPAGEVLAQQQPPRARSRRLLPDAPLPA